MVQMPYRNRDASFDLILPVLVVCNTPTEQLEANITVNAARDLPWVQFAPAHERKVVLCGGGPSLKDHIEEIRALQDSGAVVFAMNAASRFLREQGISVDAQVMADAKPETITLFDAGAKHHYIASQCAPGMFEQDGHFTLWHLAIDEDMDRLFPADKRKAGGYALIGGGAAVGNSALCVAYVLGYREFDLFGYDSSHDKGESHAYDQPMNQFIPTVDVDWAGKTYRTSVAMKAQAEKFQLTARAMLEEHCVIRVHGTGLLPAMWNTNAADLTEKDKYRLLWSTDIYREVSPAEELVDLIEQQLQPTGLLLDFGCGSGRAALELSKRGHDVLLIDFADNCRDEEAMHLPFLEWDVCEVMPPTAQFGMCCDVMEHIRPDDVMRVLDNIMHAARCVFFSIGTVPDHLGALIDQSLHLTVRPHEWWKTMLDGFGVIEFEQEMEHQSLFVVRGNTAATSH